ncbi:hypothetical protein HBI64_101700 [Parastagonospora nodorum]|nr:hypothetical protein HBI64_101700 [Parastagonospora nodorum]
MNLALLLDLQGARKRGNADRVNNNNNNERTALLAKRIKTDEDRKKSTHLGDNIEELICVSKVKNNRNNLNIIVTDLTSREFGRVDIKSLTRLSSEGPLSLPFLGLISITLYKFYKGKNIQLLRPVFELQRYDYYNPQDSDSLTRIQAIDSSFQTNQFTQQGLTPGELGSIYVLRSVDEIWADVADVFNTVVSKSDEVLTQELSSYIKTELYPHQKQALYFMWDKEQDYSAEEHDYRKFYCLVITSEDTHCKQTIKKAYIISLERASLILFMI